MIRYLRARGRARGVGAVVVLLALMSACSGDSSGGIVDPGTGPGPGTSPPDGDPGAVGAYTLETVGGESTPTLIDAVQLGPTRIETYVMGGRLVLGPDGRYEAVVYGRWIMGGQVIDRTSAGAGAWSLVGGGTLRLRPDTGGTVDMQRTWYTLTETRPFPVDATRDIDLIYVWVIE